MIEGVKTVLTWPVRYFFPIVTLSILGIFICMICCNALHAEDVRQTHQALTAQKAELRKMAEDEKKAAEEEARKRLASIQSDRATLIAAVEALKRENKELEQDIESMGSEVERLSEEEIALNQTLEAASAENRELAGLIRGNARDLETLLVQSPQSALQHAVSGREENETAFSNSFAPSKVDDVVASHPDGIKEIDGGGQNQKMTKRHDFLRPMIDQETFPSMEEIRQMASVLFREIQASGEVAFQKGTIVDRQGVERRADLLMLGNFTAIYRISPSALAMDGAAVGNVTVSDGTASGGTAGGGTAGGGTASGGTAGDGDVSDGDAHTSTSDEEIGFVIYSDQSQRFFALSRLPSKKIQDNLKAYLDGDRDDVFMDISKGAALRQMTHRLSLWEQIPKGGPIVWPIVGILGVAILILLERVLFFVRKRMNAERFMGQMASMIEKDQWDACREFLEKGKKRGKLIPKVLLTAIAFKDQAREDMENALQEAILNEIPRIERFLSTLGMLAAIAPLMGLLGTVTGMINTFHTITYYGTGDPRMMSGGISEALVTTMLGLSVAIPIMLAHTLISRKVETEIGRLEEKSVSFVNMVFKNRNGCSGEALERSHA